MTNYMELQRQDVYLCERLQKSIFLSEKQRYLVSEPKVRGQRSDRLSFIPDLFSKTLKVFCDLD